MSSVLPFEIIALIIDVVGENEDTNLLKELALVSNSFLQICNKHLFATIELYDAFPRRHVAFVELLENRPDVVKYIRKLTYEVGYHSLQFIDNDSHLLSPILPNLHQIISRLSCLTITGSSPFDWDLLDSSLKSAFLHLMHLPTINHIDLSYINNPPLSSLILSVNLRRLDIFCLKKVSDGSPEIVVQSEIPKILEFQTSDSSLPTSALLHAKTHDGQPAFNFMDLRRLSLTFDNLEDERSIRYLLQNAMLLEKLHLSIGGGRSLVQLHDILSPSVRTLKVLALTATSAPLGFAGLCEAVAGHNILEALSFEIEVADRTTEEFIASIMQNVENVLVKFRWSALRKVSFKVTIAWYLESIEAMAKLPEALQSLPDKYLSHLPKLESIAFNYSVYVAEYSEVVRCDF